MMMSLGTQEHLDYATHRTHTHTRTRITFIIVKTRSPTKDPRRSAPRTGMPEKKAEYSDKELFSYGRLGGAHHILLC